MTTPIFRDILGAQTERSAKAPNKVHAHCTQVPDEITPSNLYGSTKNAQQRQFQ